MKRLAKDKQKSLFIVIDGIDGCGSTTHSVLLANFLKTKGIKAHMTREPSEFEVGKLLRKYLKNINIPSPTDALLFAADRVEHYYNEVVPKLEENFWVISDRYLESSIAYQIAEASKETESKETSPKFDITEEWIIQINKFAPQPDLTILLDIDPRDSLKRKYTEKDDIDKFENIPFLDLVRKIYVKRAKAMKYVIIDSTGSKEEVAQKIQNEISKYIK